MRNKGQKRLMQIIRDAIVVYYEAYNHSFIHDCKHFLNANE
jgi:hypothetical protein